MGMGSLSHGLLAYVCIATSVNVEAQIIAVGG
jgi:hypothetical protein